VGTSGSELELGIFHLSAMFVLYNFEDTIRVAPGEFGGDLGRVLQRLVDRKYSNKVVPNVGLCLFLRRFTSIGEGFVFPGDGAMHFDCKFQMVNFRPHPHEVIHGR